MADAGFPRGGSTNSPGGTPTYDFAKISPKLHQIERIWTPGEGRASLVPPPLRSATGYDAHWDSQGRGSIPRWGIEFFQNANSHLFGPLLQLYRSYLASLDFVDNCRKIGLNILGPENIKWWHHQCVSHKVMTSPISVHSESSICWGAFPTSWIFIKNPPVTLLLFAFQIKYFHSHRLFHTALSNSKARQVRSFTKQNWPRRLIFFAISRR